MFVLLNISTEIKKKASGKNMPTVRDINSKDKRRSNYINLECNIHFERLQKVLFSGWQRPKRLFLSFWCQNLNFL